MEIETEPPHALKEVKTQFIFSCQSNRDSDINIITKCFIQDIIRLNCSFNSATAHHDNTLYRNTVVKF